MSRNIKVQFSMHSITIMKNTLNQMGISFHEIDEESVSIKRNYHNIVFKKDTETSCDEMDRSFVNNISQQYTLNAYKDRAIREGINLKEERLANGQIVLTRI